MDSPPDTSSDSMPPPPAPAPPMAVQPSVLPQTDQQPLIPDATFSEDLDSTKKKFTNIIIIVFAVLAVIATIIGLLFAFPDLFKPIFGDVKETVTSEANQELKTPIPQQMEPSVEQTSDKEDEDSIFVDAEIGEIIFSGEFDHLKVYDTYTNNIFQLPVNLAPFKIEEPIDEINDLYITDDASRLFFTFNNTYVGLYDLPGEKLIQAIDTGIGSNIQSWYFSPNKQYVVIDTGTAPGNRGRTIIGLDGHIYAQLSGQDFYWNHESTGIALRKGTVPLDILPYGPPPSNSSIDLVYISKDKSVTTTILTADEQTSYTPIEWRNNDTLIYKEYIYSEPFPSSYSGDIQRYVDVYEKPEILYWEINVITKEITELKGYEETQRSYNPTGESVSPSGVWKTWAEEGYVYIGKSDDSFTKDIGKGLSSVWNPVPKPVKQTN